MAADLSGPAYRCSCPSRKIPCKHALALLFVLADGRAGHAAPPHWVAEWLDGRSARAAAAATRGVAPMEADPAARERRIEARERKVRAGIEELDRWLADLMRRGLDSARTEGYRFWDAMAARLVDAQAAGLGRSVRALGGAAASSEVWPHLLLEGSARLHLLCQAYARADELPEALRADVRSQIGWATKEDDLAESDEVEDRWLVVGRRVDDTGQIMTARTFLLGESTGRFALHLGFGVETAPPTVIALPGQAFRASLAFYPSATPLRAAVRPVLVPDGDVSAFGGKTIAQVVRAHAERLALNPFVGRWPVALRAVVPVVRDERLFVREAEGAAMPVAPAAIGPQLLSVSGGRPLTLVAEWDGSRLWPMSALAGERLISLSTSDEEPPSAVDADAEWSALVSAALLGTERVGDAVPRLRVPARATGGGGVSERERGLLGEAAIVALRRRAGRRTEVEAGSLPEAAPADTRPPLTGATARMFVTVVDEHRALLPEVLSLVRTSGRRLPEESLPDLLLLATTEPHLRPTITELAGPRAGWLADRVSSLRNGVEPDLGDWDEAWATARGARDRASLVEGMRAIDPARARSSLARWLPDLAGDDRPAALQGLAVGLSAEDEPLLLQFIGDRRVDVRRAAAGVLAVIAGSQLTRVLESRARPLLSNRGRIRTSLAVELPSLDDELDRAGLAGRAPAGYGERAWLLRQLIAHVRPSRWCEWLGADAPTLVERGSRSPEARPLLEGWLEAASRFVDLEWLAAVLGQAHIPRDVRLDRRRALAAVSPEQRAHVVTRIAGALGTDVLAEVASVVPPPWPGALADAALRALAEAGQDDYPDQSFYDLARAAAIGLPVDRGDDLQSVVSTGEQLRPALESAVERIRLRGRIRAAFAELPPID